MFNFAKSFCINAGKLESIPSAMINDDPLPNPFSVTNSDSHISSIVPPARINAINTTLAIVGQSEPGACGIICTGVDDGIIPPAFVLKSV